MSSPGTSTTAPTRIGKYEVTGIAGRGAMGVVYIGRDPLLDRRVAIKVATNSDDSSKRGQLAKKMFLNEAQTAGALDHPNVLKVFDAGELDDGSFYMVMEYIEGASTLRSLCTPDKLAPIDKAVAYFRQTADALDYAHKHGIIHRDIKPSNLMLTRDGRIKVGDFGIARRTSAEQTQVVGWFGSPMYMSPEQARDEELSGQSDLFSFGVVMYQTLTGKPPFEGRGISGLIQQVLNSEPAPIRDVRPEVPERLAAIVKRCLEKSLDRRYRSGAEIVADLDALQIAGDELEPTSAEKLRLLKPLAFFEGFSDAMIGEVIKAGSWRTLPTGHVLISEGGGDTGFSVVVSGQLSVTRGDQVIGAIGTGDCAGEIAYLTEGATRRTATVTALSKVSVLQIDAKMSEWASLPLQMRVNRAFQVALINRLVRANDRLLWKATSATRAQTTNGTNGRSNEN
jgi:eukaryotic-like serine/threonine-protein kinase